MNRPRTFFLLCLSPLAVSAGLNLLLAQPTPTPTASPSPAPKKFDACALIEKKEIESVQGSAIKEAKNSERFDGDFRMSQCFYTAAEFSRSVNVTVFQKHPTEAGKRLPSEFWKHTFERYAEKDRGETAEEEKREAERKGGREEEEGVPPRRIEKLGDDAYWLSNRFGGNLYVLKGEAIISINLGGADAEEVKMDKSKKLAAKALRRFKG